MSSSALSWCARPASPEPTRHEAAGAAPPSRALPVAAKVLALCPEGLASVSHCTMPREIGRKATGRPNKRSHVTLGKYSLPNFCGTEERKAPFFSSHGTQEVWNVENAPVLQNPNWIHYAGKDFFSFTQSTDIINSKSPSAQARVGSPVTSLQPLSLP